MTSNSRRVAENTSEAIDFLLLGLMSSSSRFQRDYPLTQFLNNQLGLFPDLPQTLDRLVEQGWLKNSTLGTTAPAIYKVTYNGIKELSRMDMDSVFQQLQDEVKNTKLLSAVQKML